MKYKTRKEEAFSKVYERYQHDVYKLSLYFTGNELVAKEVASKTFFNLYLHFENVKPECIQAYVLRTARNLSYNWLRDSRLVRDGMIEDLTEESATVISVEDICVREEEKRLAIELSDHILGRLYVENPSWYDLIVQVYYFDRSNIEIAKELGVSKEVVGSRLYRAKKWIRQHFREDYENYKSMR